MSQPQTSAFSEKETEAMQLALKEAKKFYGATTPNPAVGATALDKNQNILCTLAHEKAGELHAEARVIEHLKKEGKLELLHTLVVTLEPCSHQGKTPSCAESLTKTPVKKVIYGVKDPNPVVMGSGAEKLRSVGIFVEHGLLKKECEALIKGFAKRMKENLPYVVCKIALNQRKTMIPSDGKKTFTSEKSLGLAHYLRRQSDAICTGLGTVLADQPLFSVRKIEDFQDKKRFLVVLGEEAKTPKETLTAWLENRFTPLFSSDLSKSLKTLANKECNQVLVEAGPTVTKDVIDSRLWDEVVIISQGIDGSEDEVQVFKKKDEKCLMELLNKLEVFKKSIEELKVRSN